MKKYFTRDHHQQSLFELSFLFADLKDHYDDHILLSTKNLSYLLELVDRNCKLHVFDLLMYKYYKDD